jgi:hypothetical protein
MPAHARCGHPGKVGARAGHETGGAPLRVAVRHVTVPAPVIDQLVQLPGLVCQRPCAERLLDHCTLPDCQVPGRLPLARPIGGLLGRGGGIVRAHGHPLPTPPGRFPFYTGHIQTWSSHVVALRPDHSVTIWDVMAFEACCATHAGMTQLPL